MLPTQRNRQRFLTNHEEKLSLYRFHALGASLPKLHEQVRNQMRIIHYSYRTEEAFIQLVNTYFSRQASPGHDWGSPSQRIPGPSRSQTRDLRPPQLRTSARCSSVSLFESAEAPDVGSVNSTTDCSTFGVRIPAVF